MASMFELKPCPVCGQGAEMMRCSKDGNEMSKLNPEFSIMEFHAYPKYCVSCECGAHTKPFDTKNFACKAWNRGRLRND